ncbi:hypothetical protein MNBD_NITROSPINAE02-750 [hydrothermal vent metagenome]|uniref:Rhodanese domain-containing protein n=1 Tax=hydrothermal vent metagenome TaxID=652676 RepID=A0A3B1C7B7_9ZZZZ
MNEKIRYYFSFNDPYSFILTPAVKNLSHGYRIDIDYIPLSRFDGLGMFSADEATRKFYLADASRFARKGGRKLIFDNRAQSSSGVCRAKFLADEKMLGLKYINLVFALRWVSEKDISTPQDIVEGLKFLEIPEDELVEAITGDKYLEATLQGEAMAADDGVIGVPFMTFRGEAYMGPDGLDYLENALKSDKTLVIHHDASYGVIKADELAAKLYKKEPLLVLDVRIPKEYREGHIPGSNCLPAKVVHRNFNRLETGWNITLVDDGGVDASETGFMLASRGFGNVACLSGGYPAWKGKVETGLDAWQDKLKRGDI